jgi:SAM-dependent methyltransferase
MWERNSLLMLERPPRSVTVPATTDLVGYESLVNLIQREGLDLIPGDFLEIGCFLGGGTAKLAKVAQASGKFVWVIDVFDPQFDRTRNTGGDSMAELYHGFLSTGNQEEIFRLVTRPWAASVRVIKEDSMKARLPEGTRLVFGFTDGNHDPVWVASDFRLVWSHLVAGGWAGFHDYGGDLPEVTDVLDKLMREHAGEIERIERIPEKWVLLIKKRTILSPSGL